MNAITTIQNASTMSSLQIAELTGKQHSHIMRDIRNLLEQGVSESNFGLSSYQQMQPNGGYKEVACYNLTKKGCLILASGYNAKLREAIINRWEELELANQPKVPTSFREALLLAAEQQAQIEEQQKQIEMQSAVITEQSDAIQQMQPKVSYLDTILQSKSLVTTTQIAADYGMSAKKFNIELRNLKIQHKVGGQWILYGKYISEGYAHSETFALPNSSTGRVVMNTKWTQKGRLFLYNTLKNHGIIPIIERDDCIDFENVS